MSTVAGHIQTVRRLLLGAHRPEFNVLDGAIDADDTSLSFLYAPMGIGHASYLAIDSEILYVFAVQGQSVTVMREALGTTAATHADGAIIECNPRFPDALILDEMRAEIDSWPRSVYRADAVDLTVPTNTTTVDLDGITGLIDVLEVFRKPVTSIDDRYPSIPFTAKRQMSASDFASGVALSLDRTPAAAQAVDLRVVCAVGFDTSTFEAATDLQADVGLSAGLEDALKYGVAWRLLVGREVKRTFTEAQGEPRHAEEVPPGHSTSTAQAFRVIRDKRLAEEATRLVGIYGWRMIR